MFLRPVAAPGAPDDFRCEDDFTVRQRYALLTVTEACERLRISRWMLYSLIHKQQLKTIKIGSRRLIPATALHELINRLSDQEAA
jgi:excisionase family DNA binding protein